MIDRLILSAEHTGAYQKILSDKFKTRQDKDAERFLYYFNGEHQFKEGTPARNIMNTFRDINDEFLSVSENLERITRDDEVVKADAPALPINPVILRHRVRQRLMPKDLPLRKVRLSIRQHAQQSSKLVLYLFCQIVPVRIHLAINCSLPRGLS